MDKLNDIIMKTKASSKPKPARLIGVVLLALAASMAAQATPAPLNGRVIARPVTPNNVAVYGLPANLAYSGGTSNVGLGVPVYLEADVNLAVPASGITNVTFTLASAPIGSAAVITSSPLGTNVGEYEPSDQLVYQVAAYALLQPDIKGQYVVTAAIGTTANGTTNVSLTLTAGTYLGTFTCELCHSGGLIAQDEFQYWTNTGHALLFTEGIDGQLGSDYSVSCIKCHTVGYDTNAASLADSGFYATQLATGWTFPTVLTNGNYAAMPASLQSYANIGCENCHGPGELHAEQLGNTNVPGWPLLTVSVTSGDCNQCHDDPPRHFQGTEWYASSHAVTTTIPSGSGRDQCVQCHTAYGFITRINNAQVTNTSTFPPTNTTYAAIGCQTCHEPHGDTVPLNDQHLIRTLASVTLGDGTVITNAGEGELCLDCHHSRDGGASNNVADWPIGIPTWSGADEPPSKNDFGPHDGVQGDMIEGANAITYGLTIPSSAHRYAVSNLCVGCHMQAVASTDPAFLHAGGHTFEMKYNVVANGLTNIVDQTAVCTQCHGPIASFNFPVADNNGVIVGIQTQVQQLLNQLSTLLPNSKGVVAGAVQTSLSVTTNWTTQQLNAAYNWQFVNNDGSLGVHNANFAVGLLQASIADLTGVSVAGGLPDAWELSYFGSITNAEGAPDADPAGDGIPNWLKYALGLNPLVAGLSVPNGVVYANGNALGGNSTSNSLEISTAADITWNTVAGTTYQIQEVSSLSDGWQDVGTPIVATNTTSMSYLTPTAGTLQQFFRVVETP
jgi:Doubled CXXCH motif (Paired_CXXCH_1)